MITSIIIATKNRATTMVGTLESILGQTFVPDELLVIDQSASADTEVVALEASRQIEAMGRTAPEIVYILDRGLAGAGAARNMGINRARGDILVFLDDDVVLEPDYLEKLLAVYQRDASVGGVSGMITNYSRPPLRKRFLEEFFCVGPFRDERLRLYWRAQELRHSDPVRIRKVSGCVMSIRRVAMNGQWFDADYAGAGSEDVELSWRLSERWPIMMAPQARLIHLRTKIGPARENWLAYSVKCQYYLFHKVWNTSRKNRLCFVWLNCGFAILALGSCLLRRSLGPARALISGVRASRDLLPSRPVG